MVSSRMVREFSTLVSLHVSMSFMMVSRTCIGSFLKPENRVSATHSIHHPIDRIRHGQKVLPIMLMYLSSRFNLRVIRRKKPIKRYIDLRLACHIMLIQQMKITIKRSNGIIPSANVMPDRNFQFRESDKNECICCNKETICSCYLRKDKQSDDFIKDERYIGCGKGKTASIALYVSDIAS